MSLRMRAFDVHIVIICMALNSYILTLLTAIRQTEIVSGSLTLLLSLYNYSEQLPFFQKMLAIGINLTEGFESSLS
jgi:riboflavin transporter FmnP